MLTPKERAEGLIVAYAMISIGAPLLVWAIYGFGMCAATLGGMILFAGIVLVLCVILSD